MAATYAERFLSFVNDSPTPFHAVHSAKKLLVEAGFTEIKEKESWSSTVQPGGKYYLTRNGSSIVAFAVGNKWVPGGPIAIIGAHTDSPCLRVKPVSKKQGDGFLQVGVETYGGGLWHTWFDRDLSIAGRAMVKTKDGKFQSKLIKIDRPILRIPTLAVHLDRQETFSFSKESQLFPIAGLAAAELNRTGSKLEGTEEIEAPFQPLKVLTERHHPVIVEEIAKAAGAKPEDIVDFEVVLYDTQKSVIGGANNELIFSARLDNLMMSFCSVLGLIESCERKKALDNESSTHLIGLFDHEEIGSLTAQGANSNLLPTIIRRLSVLPSSSSPSSGGSRKSKDSDVSYDKFADLTLAENATTYEQTLSGSFLISADMAHSVHPNYPAKYESDHRPEMNKGTVIKVNANARYATNSPGIVLVQEVARRAGVPLQLFVVRNDSSCGGTIGPMLSAALGTRTLDLGNPQLSMHSIRETGGVYDVEHAIKLFRSFFEHFVELQGAISVD